MKKISADEIEIGMYVYHSFFGEYLKVVPDQSGPAHRAKELKENEITKRMAVLEAQTGCLEVANL